MTGKVVILALLFSWTWIIIHSLFIPFDLNALVTAGIVILGLAWAESVLEEEENESGDEA